MFNSNAVHNVLNVLITVISSLALFDWTTLGLTPALALKIVAIIGLVKLVMNAVRDGIAGMIEPQPPVTKS